MRELKVKPKYKIGEWVKFRTGKRNMSGIIIDFTVWGLSSAVSYDICRNKQTFRMIYEDNIIELDKANK